MKLIEATAETAGVLRHAGSLGNDLSVPARSRFPLTKLELGLHPFRLAARSSMIYMVPGILHLGMYILSVPTLSVSTSDKSLTTTYYVFLKVALKAQYQGTSGAGASFPDLFDLSLHLTNGINPSSLNPPTTDYPWGNPYISLIIIGSWYGGAVKDQYITGNIQLQGRFGYVVL